MLLVMEIVFVVAFLAFLFFKVVTVTIEPLTLLFSPEGFDYFILLVLGGLAALFHFWLAKRFPQTAALEGEVTQLYRERAKGKVASAKEDKRVVVSLVIEMMMVLIIAFALWALIDQEVTIIQTDIPWLGRAVALAILVGLAVYGYFRFTNPFFQYGGFYVAKAAPLAKPAAKAGKKAAKKGLKKAKKKRPAKKGK